MTQEIRNAMIETTDNDGGNIIYPRLKYQMNQIIEKVLTLLDSIEARLKKLEGA